MNTKLGTLAALVNNQNHDEKKSTGKHSKTHSHRHLFKQRHTNLYLPTLLMWYYHYICVGNDNVPQTLDSPGSLWHPSLICLWELKGRERCVEEKSLTVRKISHHGCAVLKRISQSKTYLDPHQGLACGKWEHKHIYEHTVNISKNALCAIRGCTDYLVTFQTFTQPVSVLNV